MHGIFDLRKMQHFDREVEDCWRRRETHTHTHKFEELMTINIDGGQSSKQSKEVCIFDTAAAWFASLKRACFCGKQMKNKGIKKIFMSFHYGRALSHGREHFE